MNPCYAPAIVFFFPFESPPVLFIFGCHGSSLPHGLCSLVAASGVFSWWWLLVLWSRDFRARGLGSCGSGTLEHRLKRCGAGAYLPHGMRDGPRSGLKPVSPALAGGFFNTESAGKSLMYCF